MKFLGFEITRPQAYVQPASSVRVGRYTIVPQPSQMLPAEIARYRDAVVSARGQYVQERGMLYDYYQMAMDFDAVLQSVVQKRLIATTGKRLQYVMPDGMEWSGSAEFTAAPAWQRFISDYLMAEVFTGMGLFEFGVEEVGGRRWFTYASIPPKHIDPYQLVVRRTAFSTSTDDQSWADDPLVRFVGQAEVGGLMLQLALLALQKRSAMNDWASYCQLAGNNFMIIDYKGELPDDMTRQRAREIVYNAGRGVMDKIPGVDIEAKNLSSSSQNQLFENYVAYLDAAMTKLVLGQTMTTEDGSSRSQAEVHERVQETIVDADGRRLLNFLNYEIADLHPMYGIPAGGRWQFAESATLLTQRQIEMDLRLRELGYVWTQEEIKQRYKI